MKISHHTVCEKGALLSAYFLCHLHTGTYNVLNSANVKYFIMVIMMNVTLSSKRRGRVGQLAVAAFQTLHKNLTLQPPTKPGSQGEKLDEISYDLGTRLGQLTPITQ